MPDENTPEYTGPTGIASALYQVFVQLPYNALTTPRQAELPKQSDDQDMPGLTGRRQKEGIQLGRPVSDGLFKMVTSPDSVSSLLAQDPSLSPSQAWKKLYGDYDRKPSSSQSDHGAGGGSLAPEEALKRAADCGQWGPTQPSELFLKVS